MLIEVSDDGPGMSGDQAARAFDRFHRGEERLPDGAGLGLSIVKAITDAHGGRCWITSAPGDGTSVHVELPAASASSRACHLGIISASSAPEEVTMTDYAKAREVAEQAREKEWSRPSFGKQLFLGNFRLDLVHPAPAPSESETKRGEEFLRALRRFLETQVDPALIERTSQVPDEVVKGLAALGAFGITTEEEYGGLGLSHLDYGRALMLVGSYCPALSTLLSAHQSIGVPQPLKQFGTAGAEAEIPAPVREGRGVGLPADRTRRRLRPRDGSPPPRCGTATTTCSTA